MCHTCTRAELSVSMWEGRQSIRLFRAGVASTHCRKSVHTWRAEEYVCKEGIMDRLFRRRLRDRVATGGTSEVCSETLKVPHQLRVRAASYIYMYWV